MTIDRNYEWTDAYNVELRTKVARALGMHAEMRWFVGNTWDPEPEDALKLGYTTEQLERIANGTDPNSRTVRVWQELCYFREQGDTIFIESVPHWEANIGQAMLLFDWMRQQGYNPYIQCQGERMLVGVNFTRDDPASDRHKIGIQVVYGSKDKVVDLKTLCAAICMLLVETKEHIDEVDIR